MALADRDVAAKVGGKQCKTCDLLHGGLNEEDTDTLLGWLSNGVHSEVIARELTAEGYPISSTSIKRHRRHS